MAIIKCKMCGGDLTIVKGATVAECEYCGSVQTVPSADNEKKLTLFARANRLRSACEFDKAAGVYESIVAEFPEEAEAYWGLVLCRYGIEYVDDPTTGKKIPTCHRSSFDSVMEDSDFEQAQENADVVARKVYREEAKAIEELRKGILEVSVKEEPYDIFICYKETDEKGERTIDSVIAQDVYDLLIQKGYRVFFSRITLEDKLGEEYEPYIFAALHSAKVMLVFGTDYEYFNAVWVKNEWSRFFSLATAGSGKTLIPCYKDIDAYDMPKEFAKLQAQDMGKIGATQDLIRGIGKIIGTKAAMHTGNAHPAVAGADSSTLVLRGNMALEDHDYDGAEKYFERALDINPSDAHAYLGKFFAVYGLSSFADFENKICWLESSKEFRRAEQFADPQLLEELIAFKKSNELKRERLRLLDVVRKITKKREKEKREAEEHEIARQKWKEEDERRRRAAEERKKADAEREAVKLKRKAEEEAEWNRKVQIIDAKRRELLPASRLVALGGIHVLGIKDNGRVVEDTVHGLDYLGLYKWRNITAIDIWDEHVVGVQEDGTVVEAGKSQSGHYSAIGWRNIKSIAVGEKHTVGLKQDGTVVAVGSNDYGQCEVSGWKDITAVAASVRGTIGLKKNGTVVKTRGTEGDVSNWTDIVEIAAGAIHIIGLRANGDIVVTGFENNISRDRIFKEVGCWKDMVAIAADKDGYGVLGLDSQGHIHANGDFRDYLKKAEKWSGIRAMAVSAGLAIGLRTDGTIAIIQSDTYNRQVFQQANSWRLFNSYSEVVQKYRSKIPMPDSGSICTAASNVLSDSDPVNQKKKLEDELSSVYIELANTKGLFSGGKRRQLEARIAELEKRISSLKK